MEVRTEELLEGHALVNTKHFQNEFQYSSVKFQKCLGTNSCYPQNMFRISICAALDFYHASSREHRLPKIRRHRKECGVTYHELVNSLLSAGCEASCGPPAPL